MSIPCSLTPKPTISYEAERFLEELKAEREMGLTKVSKLDLIEIMKLVAQLAREVGK